ncbi:Uma2 family endonuclease [Salinactinospora qingdaonensis]|uniref:Uma2 family endonuclease n=2 Tax=Salinactinospora qingdaonensis TaxID=702744 RepID=A0ABP7FT55_9ACTN
MAFAVQHPELTLTQVADQLDVPKGYRVEIIGDQIIVSAPPFGRHARIVRELYRALLDIRPGEFGPVEMVTLSPPHLDQRSIPDPVVLPEHVITDDEWVFPVSAALLAVEVTSPGNADNDRVRKLRGYALAGVPLYLFIDIVEETVTLFEEPHGQGYDRHTRVAIGSRVKLPEPFSVTLDTTAFAARKSNAG